MQRQRHRLAIMAARWALDAGNLAVAESLAQAALADERDLQQRESESGDMGQALLLLALRRAATGDAAGALPLARRAVAGLERGLGAGHVRMLEARALIARLGG